MTKLLPYDELMRSFIGFDQFADRVVSNSNPNYPPYNIEKIGDDRYLLSLAVAGFSRDNIQITTENNKLTISGSRPQTGDESNARFLHRGIALRDFQRSFELAEFVEVEGASHKDGILSVTLVRNPPASKARLIEIN